MHRTIALLLIPISACFFEPEAPTDTGATTPTAGTPAGLAPGTPAGTATSTSPTVPSPCEPLGEQPTFPDAATVFGQVVSPSGTVPVVSAMVTVDLPQATWMLSRCAGAFELKLPPGVHELQVLKGRYGTTVALDLAPGQVLDLGAVNLVVPDVTIAVLDGEYDDIGSLIGEMGIPTVSYGRPADLLDNPVALADTAVIFANCGTLGSRGVDPYTPQQFTALRSWLDAGGTLYASDWEHVLFEGALPEVLDFAPDPRTGPVAALQARLIDREIETFLQKPTADILFNLSDWAVIGAAPGAETLVEADIPGAGTHPLAVRVHTGAGKAFFTSFHNEAQLTTDMELLLFEMILSL